MTELVRKKLFQLNMLGGADTKKLFSLKMLDGTGRKKLLNSISKAGLA